MCKPNKDILAKIGTKPLVLVDPTLPSFERHPFFEKKADAVRELIKRVGLPKELTNKPC